MAKSQNNYQTSIYISDSDDDGDGKLIIDETNQIKKTQKQHVSSALLKFRPNFHNGINQIMQNGNEHHFFEFKQNSVSVRLRSALTQPIKSTTIIQRMSEGNHLPVSSSGSATIGTQAAENGQPKAFTSFDIATLLSKPYKPHEKHNTLAEITPITAISSLSVSTSEVPITTSSVHATPSSETIYYALTPNYKCTICNPAYKMGPKSQYHSTKPNGTNGFKPPNTLIYSYPTMNRSSDEFPTYCIMPATSAIKPVQSVIPPPPSLPPPPPSLPTKRVRPYEIPPSMATKVNVLSSSAQQVPSTAPSAPQSQAQLCIRSTTNEKESILRSIIQPTSPYFTVILSITIPGTKFHSIHAQQQQRTSNMYNLADLNKRIHYLTSYGNIRLNLMRINNNYVSLHLLREVNNSIIDFRTLTKAETTIIRDTVRYSPKWNMFCYILQNNFLDRESSLLYSHVFQKF